MMITVCVLFSLILLRLLVEGKLVCNFQIVGITLAILSLSGNIPEFNNWIINRVSGLIITGAITLNNFDDISSYPQLFFVGRLFIMFLTIISSTFLKVKVEFICLFK